MSIVILALALSVPLSNPHVVLAFHQPPVPAAVLKAAIGEARTIWSPYGVSVDAATPAAVAQRDVAVLTVVFVRARSGHALGAIAFVDGAPGQVLTVFVDAVVTLIGTARLMGATQAQWPVTLRDQVLARAIGRVLAHEIGHFVLRTRDHAARGLMRAEHTADELVTPGNNYFVVAPREDREDTLMTKGPAWTNGR
jgi:hypothetical protein